MARLIRKGLKKKKLYKKYGGDGVRILNGEGMVSLVELMGNEKAVLNAARKSYNRDKKQKKADNQDALDVKLLDFMMRHKHTSPFEMCVLRLHVRVPMDIWRQWVRHRTASLNELSTRYARIDGAFRSINSDEWRTQSRTNKQGSGGYLDASVGDRLTEKRDQVLRDTVEFYNMALEEGVSREMARNSLSLSTYTEAYWQINLHNCLHFIRLRYSPHAQEEIRLYAGLICDIIKDWVPNIWDSFVDHVLEERRFSGKQMALLAETMQDTNTMLGAGWFESRYKALLERARFDEDIYPREVGEAMGQLDLMGPAPQAWIYADMAGAWSQDLLILGERGGTFYCIGMVWAANFETRELIIREEAPDGTYGVVTAKFTAWSYTGGESPFFDELKKRAKAPYIDYQSLQSRLGTSSMQ
jgi:thymidylate synthase (FAD)